ncbi:HET-domain-containing protein, partial [Stipitochalara longipes BDJ]
YHYSPLNDEAQEIRVIRLLPETYSSDIRICLEIKRLTQDSVPEFEAVSYTWGSRKDPVNIFIGISGNRTLAVTRNLAEALPFLRYKNKTRTLWIDAICVNQQNTEERSSQVKRMADIYSKAAKVLIWLGPASDDSSTALKCLKQVSSNVTVDWTHGTMSPLSDELHWADVNKELPFDANEFLAICNLLNRDWFRRLWIWQEVRLAKNAMVMCGTESISWTAVCSTVCCLCTKLQSYHVLENIPASQYTLLHRLCNATESVPLLYLIDWTKYSLCSDNRDRIFALLSMLNESEKHLEILPDYTKSPLEVYQEIVVRYIKHLKRLNIVTLAELHEPVIGGVSWVPNWSAPRNTDPIEHGFAGGQSMPLVTFKGDGILQVAGVAIANILVAERFAPESEEYIAMEVQRIAHKMDLENFINKTPGNLRELSRVLCSNDFSSQYSPPREGYPSLNDSEIFLRALLNGSSDDQEAIESISLIDEIYLDYVLRFCSGRSLFRSTDGHIGLGPEGAKSGDIITAWLGCGSAMILRPTGSGEYLVVGEAYCSGVMDGSAFLGPLPDSVELIARYIEGTQTCIPTYINRETGKFYHEDPRLDGVSLPKGWRKKEDADDDDEYSPWFVNDSTGEDNGDFDPRLSTEALESRGVKLQLFNL